MNTREKIQLSALTGARLDLTHEEVKRVYDIIGWATRFLNGDDSSSDGVFFLSALTNTPKPDAG